LESQIIEKLDKDSYLNEKNKKKDNCKSVVFYFTKKKRTVETKLHRSLIDQVFSEH